MKIYVVWEGWGMGKHSAPEKKQPEKVKRLYGGAVIVSRN